MNKSCEVNKDVKEEPRCYAEEKQEKQLHIVVHTDYGFYKEKTPTSFGWNDAHDTYYITNKLGECIEIPRERIQKIVSYAR